MLRIGSEMINKAVECRGNVGIGGVCSNVSYSRFGNPGPKIQEPFVEGASGVGFQGTKGGRG
jgi:hypothetical protein